MKNKDDNIIKLNVSSSEPKTESKDKKSDLENDANIKTKVGIETAGSSLNAEQKARLEEIVNLSHKRQIDNFEPNENLVAEIITNKNNELNEREISEFNNSMKNLDPARDELNDAVDKFNQKAKELGADKIINNKSLSEKDKKEQLDKLFEENPDFAEIRDRMIEKQLNYRNLHKKIERIMNNFIEKDGKLPKHILDKQKEIEKHQEKALKPEPGLSNIGDKITQSLMAIKEKIKKIFNKVFNRKNNNEVEDIRLDEEKSKKNKTNKLEFD